MSHCLIVELSDNPVAYHDRVYTDHFDDDMDIQHVADYICEVDNIDEALKTFLRELGDSVEYNAEENSITFKDSTKFFQESYLRFLHLIDTMSIDKFCNPHWSYQITNSVSPLFGTYIYHTGECSYSINDFIRLYGATDKKFYIGGILDYHC